MSTDTASIFALTYVYTDDSARIDEVRPAHRAFLRELHESGTLLASGPFADDGPAAHGIAGLVTLYGIESPGLTASLAIGDHVAGLLD